MEGESGILLDDMKGLSLNGTENIILAGLDCTGKTTFAGHLSVFNFGIHHFGESSTGTDVYEKYLNFFNQNHGKKLILDRSFLCEIAYGNTFRNGSRISEEQYISLLKLAKIRNTIIIYLYASKKTIEERIGIKQNYEDFKIIKEYEKIINEYKKALDIAREYLKVFEYSTTDKTIFQIGCQLIKDLSI